MPVVPLDLFRSGLPVEEALPELRAVLSAGREAVLQAPPGAGKTTLVPLALLGEPWMAGQRMILLEPRRLAARGAAHRMARLLGEEVGETVGYRIRLDTRVGPRTRIEVVTEGILTRLVQDDPSLEGVGLVLFDEYHERSLQADLGLALCLESRSVFRPDLRLLVMSATLDGARVAALLDGAPLLESEGRSYPVETRYLEEPIPGRIEPAVSAAVHRALREAGGDVLVFLPGEGEIRRVEQLLKEGALPPGVFVAPLYGSLPQGEQDRALAPSAPGERKVVLATSIAETSLTIEGVRVVVDSGLMRVPRFSPRSGMTRLETLRVSRASADQRRGRAGRLGPGICWRLWTRLEQQHLAPFSPPEILEADLAPLVLELALWGATDPGELSWLDVPPEAAWQQARELLEQLGAVSPDGLVTEHGREMARLGVHPRLAHMMLMGRAIGEGTVACELAALLGERDLFRASGAVTNADLRLRLEALRRGGPPASLPRDVRVSSSAARHVQRLADHWKRQLKVPWRGGDVEACGLLAAFAYPDRIAQLRPGQPGRFRLRNGRGAALTEAQLLTDAPYLVAAELDGRERESRIFLAAPVGREELLRHFDAQIVREDEVAWDREARRVRARRVERLGAVVLGEQPLAKPDPERLAEALLEGIAAEGLHTLSWSKEARRLQERINFVHRHDPAFPDVSDEALAGDLAGWLKPHCYGMKRLEEVQRLDLSEVLLALLTWEQRRALDDLAPTHWEVPSGSRIAIDYGDPGAPVLPVRLQEMFGATETPRIAGGRVPLTLHLLSPAHRPVQVTQDLASFWREAYFDVRKNLRGRYPKHYWPENPLEAEPTRRTKPRR